MNVVCGEAQRSVNAEHGGERPWGDLAAAGKAQRRQPATWRFYALPAPPARRCSSSRIESCKGHGVPASPYISELRRHVGRRMLVLPSVTSLVFDDEDRVLLVEHGDTGRWVAPGGCIEPDETPADAAARELLEETGLLAVPSRILGVYGGRDFVVRYSNGDEVSYVMTVFECTATGGTLRPDGDEVNRAAYFSAGGLPPGLAPWAEVVLPVVMANRNSASFEASTWRPGTTV